jgi:molecular chaperone GrpE
MDMSDKTHQTNTSEDQAAARQTAAAADGTKEDGVTAEVAGADTGAAADAASDDAAETEGQSTVVSDGQTAGDTESDGSDENGVAASDDARDAQVEQLQTQVQELQTQVQELQNQLLRARADFDNYRRRTRQEMEDLRAFATRQLLADLLPIADNFERALSAIEGHEEVKTGVEMVHRQLLALLEKHGVEPMKTVGETFDPNFHEAVMQEPAGDREAGIVAEELQKGYLLHGRVLRPAMVKVTV